MIAATNNPHKLAEMRAILSQLGIELESMAQAGVVSDPEETGATFTENARIKAEALYRASGRAAIADDSGIAVDALAGAPGVYSARYGGEGLTDAERTALLLSQTELVPEGARSARFVCAICALLDDGSVIEVSGECEGELLRAPDGDGGFGYDPVFFSTELEKSFGSASKEEKNSVSHRARALDAFAKEYKKRMNIV